MVMDVQIWNCAGLLFLMLFKHLGMIKSMQAKLLESPRFSIG